MPQIFNTVADIIDFFTYYDYSRIAFILKILAALFSIVFIYGIFYAFSKTTKIVKSIHAFDKPKNVPKDLHKNIEEWKKILDKANSEDQNERKFAIIAADSLIEKILGMSGYHGENLGEKLKMIEKGDLDSLNDV